MFENMPAPTATVVKSGKNFYGHVEREVKTSFVLNPEASGANSAEQQIVVEVTTRHSPEAKTFNTSVSWVGKHHYGALAVTTWGSDHGCVQISRTPVARYSKSAMEAHHEVAMATVEQRFSHVAWVFAEAAQQITVGQEA